MTLKNPDASGFDTPEFLDEMLAHLRAESGMDTTAFADNPVRLLGGFDTLIFAFNLAGVTNELAGPLVIRLFSETGGAGQARKETVFQNAMADAGYPVPRVVIPGGERKIGGRPFNVMERVQGHSLMEEMMGDPEATARVIDQLAHTQSELHTAPSSGVADSLRESGIAAEEFRIVGQLRYVQRCIADPALTHLEPIVAWLIENRPDERDELSICHGDFHPGNVMVDGGRVSGVLDWPGALLADAEYDVAITLVLMTVAGPSLVPDAPPGVFDAFAAAHLDSYSRRRTLDAERLRYYRAQRTIRAFIRGTAARTPGVDPELAPRDQYPWSEEGATRRLVSVIKEATGIDAQLPPGVEPE